MNILTFMERHHMYRVCKVNQAFEEPAFRSFTLSPRDRYHYVERLQFILQYEHDMLDFNNLERALAEEYDSRSDLL